MTRLILIRHGESEANRGGIFAGHLDAELQHKGVLQAEKTAKFIKENYSVDRVYASDLIRARRTGQAVADLVGVEIVLHQGLREIGAGIWDGLKFDDLPTLYPEEYNLWISDIGRSFCPGGEKVSELGERVMNTLTEIACENDEKTVVVATHATPIRAAETLIRYGDLAKMQEVPWVSNASVTIFEYDGGVWSCVERSLDEHLGELRTVLPKNI